MASMTPLVPETISALELVWTGIAILGVLVAAGLLGAIWRSYLTVRAWIRDRRAVAWGPRHLFVLGFTVGIGLLLLVWLGFVALGGNAMANPQPVDPARVAASERGGWILICLEGVLLVFTMILAWAWVAVGRPSLRPGNAPRSLAVLLFEAIDAGRAMGHAVANDSQAAVAILDEIARDATCTPERRAEAAEALASLDRMTHRARELHVAMKALEDVA